MKIDKQLVEHVGKLAHLRLKPEEIEYYEIQLTKVLGYIEQLQELRGADVAADGFDKSSTPERTDVAIASRVIEAALAQSPEHIGTAFQVPRIIE